jgi:hypothetical protein
VTLHAELLILQGPGILIALSKFWRPTNKYIQFDFHEKLVLNGMVVTTDRTNYVKNFRIRANKYLNRPHRLSEDDKLVANDKVNLFKLIQTNLHICL